MCGKAFDKTQAFKTTTLQTRHRGKPPYYNTGIKIKKTTGNTIINEERLKIP